MPVTSSIVANPGSVSHWFRQMYAVGDQRLVPRAGLTADRAADVCIVGAGYTGLWTAYYLLKADPSRSVVLLEAQVAGYGASGRNGGAVIAQFNGSRAYWSKRSSRDGVIAMEKAVQGAVDAVGDAVAAESIDCSYAKNGVVMIARTELEANRFRESVADDRRWGLGDADTRYLSSDEVRSRIAVDGAIGARFNSHCASIDPGRLVRGLADSVERLGATIYEGTRVVAIEPGRAVTADGHEVRAPIVVRATEAYTESLKTHRRLLVPVHTSMLVTEQIDVSLWEEIGWSGREALLAEHPFLHLQHTADRRITIGGDDNRVPYRYRSAPSRDTAAPPHVLAMYHAELIKLFPVLKDVRIEHSWQGVFAASREWAPSVWLDSSTGVAWGGGYVGEGVATSNLAGQTLADLILGRDTERTRLALVRPPARRWEPEPLRAIGSVGISWLRHRAEHNEVRTGRPSVLIRLADKAAGYTGHIG